MFNEKDDVVIGRVLSPHGLDGMVKVFPYSDYPERIGMLHKVELILDTDRHSVVIERASVYGRFWLIKFEGIDTREDVQLLGGSKVVIPRYERLPLPEDAFYHDQLVGLKVYDTGGELMGLIVDINATGGHDLLVIERIDPGEHKILIPAVKKFIRRVDLEEKKVIVDLPEGLLEL